MDGVSWRIIGEDLNTAYQQLRNGQPVKLPARTSSYNDYARALTAYSKSEKCEAQRPYWDKVLGRAAAYRFSAKDRSSCEYDSQIISLDNNITAKLQKECNRAYGTDTQQLILSAIGIAYHSTFGENGVNIRLEGHGREAFDEELSLSRTIGWFTSIYPLVLENLDKDIRKVIRNTKEELRRIPMKGAGYPVIYGIETEYLPLITFNYLGDMASGSKQAMLHQTMTMPVADFIAPENHYGTDININSLISDDHLTLHVELNKSQFAPAICRRFINHLETSMKQVISHCYEVKIPENTASDFGELEWNDDEFLRIEHDYQARNEHIQKIEPVSKEMEDKLIHFMRRIDMPSCATETIFEIDRSIPHDVAEAAVAEMNQRFSFVRKKVVRTGVSSCKVITTDHGTALHYCEDYLEHEDRIWTSIEQLKTKMRQISLDLQHESSLQIALLNCSAKRSYLIICGNGIFTNDSQMRACLSLLFRQLAAPLHDPANLMEWAEILCIADELRQQKEAAKADTVCLPEDPEDNPSTAYEPIHMYCEVPSQKSVFFVHTANTGSKAYYLFAKKLKERCTFGVFEQYNLFHPHQLLTSIEAIATKYIHVLQEKQPHGPYHLGGWCYGGTVAYEMAQQLKLAGETDHDSMMNEASLTTIMPEFIKLL